MATTDALPGTAPSGDLTPEPANNNALPSPVPPVAASTPPAKSLSNPIEPPAKQAPAPALAVFEPASDKLVAEIKTFERDSLARYRFNNRWDVFLSILGILLSIAVVGAGFVAGKPWLTAILGAVVGAVITAQKAFPFGQRAAFYRILIGQSRNLITRAEQNITDKKTVVNTLASLRMDYAQQLPRGSSSQSSDNPAPASPAAPAAAPAAQTPGGKGDAEAEP